MKPTRMRIGDLEVFISDSMAVLRQFSTDSSVPEVCWGIAYWERSKGGENYLKFVSNRPFATSVDVEVFWKLAKFGQELLDEQSNY
jgi:hypothetical protein